MSDIYRKDALTIEVSEDEEQIIALWSGKSVLRNPAEFIVPILTGILRKTASNEKRIILDFRALSYMNSSTITPIIKMLEQAKSGNRRLELRYMKSLRWQETSFTALRVFESGDGRVRIAGSE